MAFTFTREIDDELEQCLIEYLNHPLHKTRYFNPKTDKMEDALKWDSPADVLDYILDTGLQGPLATCPPPSVKAAASEATAAAAAVQAARTALLKGRR